MTRLPVPPPARRRRLPAGLRFFLMLVGWTLAFLATTWSLSVILADLMR